MRRET